MAETITIAGKKFPKTGVYIAAAVTAGIVGYAWFTKGSATADIEVPETPEPVDPPTDEPGFDVIGGGPERKTNADWTDLAVTRMMNIGIDGAAASSAIGKFLARKALTKTEADLVRQAIAHAGYPPENGPWTIIESTNGGITKPNAPKGLKAEGISPTQVSLVWQPVNGVESYVIKRDNGSWTNIGPTPHIIVPAPNDYRTHSYSVAGVSEDGTIGYSATTTARTITEDEMNRNLRRLAGSGFRGT